MRAYWEQWLIDHIVEAYRWECAFPGWIAGQVAYRRMLEES